MSSSIFQRAITCMPFVGKQFMVHLEVTCHFQNGASAAWFRKTESFMENNSSRPSQNSASPSLPTQIYSRVCVFFLSSTGQAISMVKPAQLRWEHIEEAWPGHLGVFLKRSPDICEGVDHAVLKQTMQKLEKNHFKWESSWKFTNLRLVKQCTSWKKTNFQWEFY